MARLVPLPRVDTVATGGEATLSGEPSDRRRRVTGHQKEWQAKENRERHKALFLLLDSGPISEAWAAARNKSDRYNLIQHRRLATLRMFAEGSLSRWEGKCSSPEEWIERAVEETRGVVIGRAGVARVDLQLLDRVERHIHDAADRAQGRALHEHRQDGLALEVGEAVYAS